MSIEQANSGDLQEILRLQRLAFQGQAVIYNDYTIPPLVETLEEIQTAIHSHSFLKYVDNCKIIGSVRCIVYLRCLIGNPFQNCSNISYQ